MKEARQEIRIKREGEANLLCQIVERYPEPVSTKEVLTGITVEGQLWEKRRTEAIRSLWELVRVGLLERREDGYRPTAVGLRGVEMGAGSIDVELLDLPIEVRPPESPRR